MGVESIINIAKGVLGGIILFALVYLIWKIYSAISGLGGLLGNIPDIGGIGGAAAGALGEAGGAAGGLLGGVFNSKVGQFGVGAVGSAVGVLGGTAAGSIGFTKSIAVDGILNGQIFTNPKGVVNGVGGGLNKIGNSIAKPFKKLGGLFG
jgi:hypothetical protein